MNAKHTPGPWKAEGATIRRAIPEPEPIRAMDPKPRNIVAYSTPSADGGQCVADARLIAAAPDLLEALQEWRNNWKHIPEDCRKHFILASNITNRAILKSEGK